MTEGTLQLLYSELFQTHFQKRKYSITAKFYATKRIRHMIELKSKNIVIKIAEPLREAPERILAILGLILFTKLFRYNIDKKLRREYNQYVDDFITPMYKPKIRKPSTRYRAQGNFYDLDIIFEEINRNNFKSELRKPIVGWSLNKSYSRLGFYSEEKNLLAISKIFDSRKVPVQVVKYLMYHEMLHIHIPTKMKNGRRIIHSAEFRKLDKAFPDYNNIQNWIKRKRIKL